MFLPNSRRLLIKLVTLGALVTCAVVLTRGVYLAGYGNSRGQLATAPAVSVRPQPDAPLRLNVIGYDSSDPQAPSVLVEVTNAGTKAVRAFTISQETFRGEEKSSGFMVADNITSPILQPGQYSTESVTYQQLPEVSSRVVLSLDFVVFEDEAVWGPDAEKSSEILAGRLAGALEAGKQLLEIRKQRGLQAAIESTDEGVPFAAPPPGRSPAWGEGFTYGRRFIRQHLKRVMSKHGAGRVEKELEKLSDKISRGK